MSFVYFIKPAGLPGPIKIGCSVHPDIRLVDLERWSPVKLGMIGFVPGTFRDEKFLHNRFSGDRSHGEWFHATPDLLSAIKSIIAAGSIEAFFGRRPSRNNTVVEIIESLGGCPTFARAVGITDSHARTMMARNSIPARYWLVVVSAAQEVGLNDVTLSALADLVAEPKRTAHELDAPPVHAEATA